jgi:hypothetical protein
MDTSMNNEDKILEKLDKIIELLTTKTPLIPSWGAWDEIPKTEPEIDIQDMRQKDKKSDDPLKD